MSPRCRAVVGGIAWVCGERLRWWKNIKAAFSLEHESLVLGQILTISRILDVLTTSSSIQYTHVSMQREHFIDKQTWDAFYFPETPIFTQVNRLLIVCQRMMH